MNKRLISFLSIMMLSAYMIAGCAQPSNVKGQKGNQQGNQQGKENTTIVTSFYPIYLHVINIAKDIPGVEVLNMTQPQTGCLHDYQLSPEDIKTLDGADIFVINGGGMESFMDKILAQLEEMPIINASEHIALIEEDHHEHEEEHEEEGHQLEFNPHVWVSVTGAIEQVEQIAKELGVLDPNNKDLYAKNAEVYMGKLKALQQEMHASLDQVPNKNIVTFHEAFSYFAEEFGFNIVGTIVTETGSEPSAKDLSKVILDIKAHDVKAVFTEPQYTSKAANLISQEAGVGLYTLDPVVTSGPTLNQEDEYIKKMKENLKTLEEALR